MGMRQYGDGEYGAEGDHRCRGIRLDGRCLEVLEERRVLHRGTGGGASGGGVEYVFYRCGIDRVFKSKGLILL